MRTKTKNKRDVYVPVKLSKVENEKLEQLTDMFGYPTRSDTLRWLISDGHKEMTKADKDND